LDSITPILTGHNGPNAGRFRISFVVLLCLLVVLFFLDLFLGSISIPPGDFFRALFHHTGGISETIIYKFRFPKAVTALTVGIALSVSGLQMQTLFRNPIAGPDVLGISSGASLGVAFVILGFSADLTPDLISGAGNWAIAAASWVGAGIVMVLMMVISMRVRSIMTVLILGIMLSSGISALVTIMQYFTSESMLKTYIIWSMGSLGNLTSSQLTVMLISIAAGLLLANISVKQLNALLLGENYARSIGLNLQAARFISVAATCILAGTVTAFCGPIGFIGIAVPHLARISLRTADHRVLIPGTVIIGASVMLLCDMISQLPGSESVLPVNSVTALIGIPVVIWVILRNRKFSEIF
jgi:iron complex transport system permease protein